MVNLTAEASLLVGPVFLVPMSCCDEAAKLLTKALGGEEVARRMVGGVKWWQVRVLMGGYFMGSVDQERYSIQRHARKINVASLVSQLPRWPHCLHFNVFLAINYRLAPQYPFPCALQDALASYLYLINPPPEAEHRPVKPSQIIVAGDSAGGDLGLPAPAGGVLISPWSDLTHSFPSVHLSTDTDVVPPPLWPPPSDEMTKRANFENDHHSGDAACMKRASSATLKSPLAADIGATITPPSVDSPDYEPLTLQTDSGETLTLIQQGHMYTPNRLLNHPLVSPALSYLGGLPPLLFHYEILYTAHKAAHPEKYPVQDRMRDMYPVLQGIETRYQATSVHLQVYDDTAHILPVLFSSTTPAKFCFRAIASFCKYVTGSPQQSTSSSSLQVPLTRSRSGSFSSDSNSSTSQPTNQLTPAVTSPPSEMTEEERLKSPPDQRISLKSLSQKIAALSTTGSKSPERRNSKTGSKTTLDPSEAICWRSEKSGSWDGKMIRERVSTKGVVRPLEAEDQLAATTYPPELLGTISELLLRRLIDAVQRHENNLLQSTLSRRHGYGGGSFERKGDQGGADTVGGELELGVAVDGMRRRRRAVLCHGGYGGGARLAKIADLGVFQQDGNRSLLGIVCGRRWLIF
ncbi:Alpha/Beta hydrolase protein [Mucidula mucida]|nr:Alpha/Beta hydrolase protein [Mucidula mucida]